MQAGRRLERHLGPCARREKASHLRGLGKCTGHNTSRADFRASISRTNRCNQLAYIVRNGNFHVCRECVAECRNRDVDVMGGRGSDLDGIDDGSTRLGHVPRTDRFDVTSQVVANERADTPRRAAYVEVL